MSLKIVQETVLHKVSFRQTERQVDRQTDEVTDRQAIVLLTSNVIKNSTRNSIA